MEATWLVLVAGVGAAAGAAFGLLRVRRQLNENQTLKTEIKKWEDEGGSVPEVPTVSPTVISPNSVPTRQ